MIALEIYELLGKICEPHDCYYNVMGCDSLRNMYVTKFPMAIVVNTRPAPETGHWCAFYMQDEFAPMEFFDTYNMPPDVYNNQFRKFITRMSPQMLTMPRAVQCFDSDACGHHCLNFVNSRLKRKTIEYLYTNVFKPGCRNNDSMSKNFVNMLKKRI